VYSIDTDIMAISAYERAVQPGPGEPRSGP